MNNLPDDVKHVICLNLDIESLKNYLFCHKFKVNNNFFQSYFKFHNYEFRTEIKPTGFYPIENYSFQSNLDTTIKFIWEGKINAIIEIIGKLPSHCPKIHYCHEVMSKGKRETYCQNPVIPGDDLCASHQDIITIDTNKTYRTGQLHLICNIIEPKFYNQFFQNYYGKDFNPFAVSKYYTLIIIGRRNNGFVVRIYYGNGNNRLVNKITFSDIKDFIWNLGRERCIINNTIK